MTSTPPTSQPASVRQCKTLHARPVAINKLKQLQSHFPGKTGRDYMSTECDQFKIFCCLQLRRLFTDFWSKESKLTVLSELVTQKNVLALAILREHIKHLMLCIHRAPSAEVLVPLFKSAVEGDIALSKAHLSHLKMLFCYVCLAFKTCACVKPVCNITTIRGRPRGPPRRVVYPCLATR